MRRWSLAVLLCLFPAQVAAQESAEPEFQLPDVTELVPLRRGQAAPSDGLLINSGEMLSISQEFDRLRYVLERTEERAVETCDVRVEMERARITACEERLRLRDDLWGARQAELAAMVEEARERAVRAAERGWWEQPLLWLAVGAAVVGAIWIAVEVE